MRYIPAVCSDGRAKWAILTIATVAALVQLMAAPEAPGGAGAVSFAHASVDPPASGRLHHGDFSPA